MANNQNIVATQSAGGTAGTSLAWFAAYGAGAPQAVAYTAEVQTLAITGTPAVGDTIQPTWKGLAPTAQVYNVATGTLQTALQAAWGITVLVGGTAGTSYTFTFPAGLGNVAAVVPNFVRTGASTGVGTVTETTPGAGANPATAIIPAAYKDAGLCDPTGLVMKVADTTKDITAFGSLQIQRTLVTQSKQTFDVLFLETNHTTLEIYHRLPIGSTGTADATGYISGVTDGPVSLTQYASIFDIVDGVNHLRAFCPNVLNTNRGDMNMPFGEGIKRPITLTAFPDSNGNSVYWYPVVGALAGL